MVDPDPCLPHHPGMDRRSFLLTSLAGALAGPLTAGAQQTGEDATWLACCIPKSNFGVRRGPRMDFFSGKG